MKESFIFSHHLALSLLISNPSMKDENDQDGASWSSRVNEMNRLSQRAAKLSERGAHYFVGWLIGAGMQKPAMMAEFENVLARLEVDPKLRHCWRDGAKMDVAAAPAEASIAAMSITVSEGQTDVATEALSVTDGKPEIATEAPPVPVFEEHVHEHARSGMVKLETASDAGAPERQGFFAKIFRRQRMAA